MDELLKRLKQQEEEVKELENQLFSRPEFSNNSRIEELRAENEKLNYRANVLIRNIEELKSKPAEASKPKKAEKSSGDAKAKKTIRIKSN